MVLSFGSGLPLAAGLPMVRGPRGGGGASPEAYGEGDFHLPASDEEGEDLFR